MASSYQDRLKARRGGGVTKKKPKELKLNATKRVRGKLVYWNPYTKSWSKTKVIKKVVTKKEKLLTRAQKLKKDGMATWNTNPGNKAEGAELPGSKMVKKTEKPKSETETKAEKPKTEVKTESNNNKLKIKSEKKVEKKDPLAGYRRGPGTKLGKDTRITKKLKKAGFTEDRLARLRKKHAEFKAKRKKKKTS